MEARLNGGKTVTFEDSGASEDSLDVEAFGKQGRYHSEISLRIAQQPTSPLRSFGAPTAAPKLTAVCEVEAVPVTTRSERSREVANRWLKESECATMQTASSERSSRGMQSHSVKLRGGRGSINFNNLKPPDLSRATSVRRSGAAASAPCVSSLRGSV